MTGLSLQRQQPTESQRTAGKTRTRQPERLRITLLNTFSVQNRDGVIDLSSQKAKAILAYLLLNASGRATREQLCSMFWSETQEKRARASLRQVIRALKSVTSADGSCPIEAKHTEVSIHRERFEVDVLTAVRQLERQRVPELLLGTPRPLDALLADLDDLDRQFSDWLLVYRHSLHERFTRQLEDNLRQPATAPAQQQKICRALLNLDPSNERAGRRLMLLYARDGDVATALQVYNSLWQVLDSEHDMEPTPLTQQLVAEIKLGVFDTPAETGAIDIAGATQPSVAPHGAVIAKPSGLPHTLEARGSETRGVPPPGRKPLICVADFTAKRISADKIYLVNGFRHELIASLVRFREWVVIDLKTTREADVVAAAKNTVAGPIPVYRIHTTVYQTEDTFVLVLTLQEDQTGVCVWSDRFQLSLDAWLTIQHSIIRRAAMALNVTLSAKRLSRLTTKLNVSLSSFDLWLKAESQVLSFQPSEYALAREAYQTIIDTDPDFPGAYLGLVRLENGRHLVSPGQLRSLERLTQGLKLAKKVLKLEPLDSRAHLCLAWSYAMTRHYQHAVQSFQDACRLNENDAWTLISSAQGLAFCGAHRQAVELADLAQSLAVVPSTAHWAYQVSIRFLSGDYRLSIEAAEHAGRLIWNLPAWKAAALYHLGRVDQAAEEAEQFLTAAQQNWTACEPAGPLAVTRWLLQCFPIRRIGDWRRLRDGLAGARLPVPDRPEY